MSKKYRLLKDLPDAKSGTIFELDKEGDSYDYTATTGEFCWYRRHFIENNPDWFELINERIEVGKIEYAVTFYGHVIEVYTDKPTPKEKFPLIKQAIEAIINNDNLTMDFTGSFDYLKEKKYTQEQLEAAFHSGRGRYVNHRNGETKYDYQTFQDYFKELQQNQP